MVVCGQFRAQMMERGAYGSLVQAFDQDQRGERAVIAAHAFLAGLDRGFRDIGEKDTCGNDAVELRKLRRDGGSIEGRHSMEPKRRDNAALAEAGRSGD